MAKFKVGGKVRYVSGGCFDNSEELYVIDNDGSERMPLLLGPNPDDTAASPKSRWVDSDEVEMVEQPDKILTRIAAIESQLAALLPLVKAERKPSEIPQSQNAARKAVIERAREFVVDLTKRAESSTPEYDGNIGFKLLRNKTEFHVNTEKGVVTALAKSPRYGDVNGKAFARCSPGDVFNADIGKAISVGRLYGVDIPQVFFNAPKPDYANGQLLTFKDGDSLHRKVEYRVDNVDSVNEFNMTIVRDDDSGESMVGDRAFYPFSAPRHNLIIINDTEAQY